MNKLIQTFLYTLRDQTRYKSFFILLAIAALFVFLVRGCYHMDYVVNGQKVDSVAFAQHVSNIVFQVICYGMFLMTTLLSMKLFSRDRNDGSTVMFLCRPVHRWQYVLGRILGTWMLCTLFMMTLHAVIFAITWSNTGQPVPGFLLASLVSSVNVLFITVTACLFSMFMPDFIAALACVGIIGIGFISETGYRIIQSDVFQAMSRGNVPTDSSLWRILFPKINMLQFYAGTMINDDAFKGMGYFHPVINVLIYIVCAGVVLMVVFNRKEVE